ncbi:MAG TPA: capsule biosynthesis protein CapA [Paracoccaceae bacterium]|nr:capsule biosynthesis protein CapA [Paracoccaceae bacterium]
MDAAGRTFLFLQGPHGPFFAELAQALAGSGGRVLRVGFNRGDAAEWHDRASYVAFTASIEAWPGFLAALIARERVTDLVLYGDTRACHAVARALARSLGLTVHCFEEGYLRPWWITYERGGVNGHSRLMDLNIADMRAAIRGLEPGQDAAPAHWGAVMAHAWLGMLYHFHVLCLNRRYPSFRTHRRPGVARELILNMRKLALRPFLSLRSRQQQRRLERRGMAYHLVLLQLPHDSAMLHHSPFRSVASFMEFCLDAFMAGADPGEHLVFKTHPFDDGREPIERIARRLARERGIGARVQVIQAGRLGPLLDGARSVVTVNSTAGQQALWRGLPVSVLGASVYGKPELVSDQPLAAFFAAPRPPDAAAYRDYRRFLLATSQVRGGFYTAEGRASAVPRLITAMLDRCDPYDRLLGSRELVREDFAAALVHRPRALGLQALP